MAGREKWSSRQAFILAAIGSAIGLGNIWRFPFKCYENGGGAFLVAYLIAMLTAGVPLLILELSLGHRFKLAAPLTFAKVDRKYEWIGWWAVIVGFMITTYYAVVMAWGLNYSVFSFTQSWGSDPNSFFYNDYLSLTDGPLNIGKIQLPIFIALIISWILIVAAIWKGAKTVSKVVYLTVIIPWILLIVFVVRGVTLPGSGAGLIYYLKPQFVKLLDPQVWIAAYGQVFFSLSIGFGIMIAYASFLPKESDIINSAFIIALSDGATAFIGGFAVFGALGYYAQSTGQAVQDVLKGGPGLAFVTYPDIINKLPFSKLFGILFFLMLLTLAIDSAFSLVEAVSASLRDKYGWTHKKSNIIVALAAFGIGILITTGAGLFWLDILDKWLEVFGLSVVVLLECFIIGWVYRIDNLREYANKFSEVKIGYVWVVLIKFVIPIVVLALIVTEAVNLVTNGYGDYPFRALLLGGWIVVFLLPIIALIIAKTGTTTEVDEVRSFEPRTPYIYETGFRRLNHYFMVLLILGTVLVGMIVLSYAYYQIKAYIVYYIGGYVFLALIGGAIYFSIIAAKDGNRREIWAKTALPEDEE
jgi:neurotransmitter:Na+ symporter, NSS family